MFFQCYQMMMMMMEVVVMMRMRWRIWHWWGAGDEEDKPGNDGGAGDENVDGVGNNGDEDGGCGNSQILKRSCKVIM